MLEDKFQTSLKTFRKQGSCLPGAMHWKLEVILSLIDSKQVNEESLSMEQQMELRDLENLDIQGLKIIFSSIIKTLFNDFKDLHKFCQIRREKGLFRKWVSGSIKFEKTLLTVAYGSKIKHVCLKSSFIKKSSAIKNSIEIQCQNSLEFTIKFQSVEAMKDTINIIQSKIIEENNRESYNEMSKLHQLSLAHEIPKRVLPFQSQMVPGCIKEEEALSQEQKSHQFHSDQNDDLPAEIISMPAKDKIKSEVETTRMRFKLPLKKLMFPPHGYEVQLQTAHSVIALGQEAPKIYVEIEFQQEIQMKRLIALLINQKCWNKFLAFEKICRRKGSENCLQVSRKLDTFEQTGDFLDLNLEIKYTYIGHDVCLITTETDSKKSDDIRAKGVMTINRKHLRPHLIVEEEFQSDKFNSCQLKKVLLALHRSILSLDLIYDKVVNKNFEAEQIVQKLIEQAEASNSEDSQEDEVLKTDTDTKSTDEGFGNIKNLPIENIVIQENSTPRRLSDSLPEKSKLRLEGPSDRPDYQFIKEVKNRLFEMGYYKCKFSQNVLENYESTPPMYKLANLIESKQYEVISSRELRFINQEVLDNQKDTVKFIMKQIGGNLISGKSVLNVSLPVDIFESRSALERGASSYGSCPDLLQPVSHLSVFEQIKAVSTLVITQLTCELLLLKPFNPILGETFQGYIKGIPIFYEQISHNPPISSYFMKCPEFTLYGNLVPFADVGLNTATGGNSGVMHIEYPNGTHFQCFYPPTEIAGIIYGDRKFRPYSKGYVLEKKHKLFTQFSIQHQKKGVYQAPKKLKTGEVIGGIFEVKQDFIESFENHYAQHKSLKKFGGITKEKIVKKLNSIEGEWFGSIFIDGQISNKQVELYPVQYSKSALPSDSNFRLDILYHKMFAIEDSQREKEVYQVLQRADRKLKEKNAKVHK